MRLLDELALILERAEYDSSKDSSHFFQLLLHVFDHVCRAYQDGDENIQAKMMSFIGKVVDVLREYDSREVYEKPGKEDTFLTGLLNLVWVAVHYTLFGEDEARQLCAFVYEDCMFNVPRQDDYGAKCKSAFSRRIGFGVLMEFGRKYPECLDLVQEYVVLVFCSFF